MDDMLKVIMNRGTATYRNGKLDFTNGEGGNNHIHCYDKNGKEIGYIWFDTHSYRYGFCGKSNGSCRGVFREILEREHNEEWYSSDCLFPFTEESFREMIEDVINLIR